MEFTLSFIVAFFTASSHYWEPGKAELALRNRVSTCSGVKLVCSHERACGTEPRQGSTSSNENSKKSRCRGLTSS
jgi:hypothetical protein